MNYVRNIILREFHTRIPFERKNPFRFYESILLTFLSYSDVLKFGFSKFTIILVLLNIIMLGLEKIAWLQEHIDDYIILATYIYDSYMAENKKIIEQIV